MSVELVILVHGGVALIISERIPGKMLGVKSAAQEGHQVLFNGSSALDAVEVAVRWMEDNSYFNAGFGSVLNIDGAVEMDASIMDGRDLSYGAVAMVRDVTNPISLARRVKEQTAHVLLAGSGTSNFAKVQNIPTVAPVTLVSDYAKEVLEAYKSRGGSIEVIEMGGTVGAVAVDCEGNVAAATSTGGTNGKMIGRIGDTAQIGSGTYADNNTGAVSCTGNGEMILKFCLAHAITKEIETGKTASNATIDCVNRMSQRLRSTADAISVDKCGNIGVAFTTRMMPWAYRKGHELHFGLELDEHLTDII